MKQNHYWFLMTTILLGIILIGGCVQEREMAQEREISTISEAFTVYQDYLGTIKEGFRNTPSIYDKAVVEATVISLTNSEVCPYQEEDCSIEPYPDDWATVRIDRIISYTPYSEQNPPAGQPTEEENNEQPGGEGINEQPSNEGGVTPDYKPLDRPLEEGQEVSTHFLLTARPARTRHITMYTPRGGPESAQAPIETDSEQINQTGPWKKIFKPIPKEPVHTDIPGIDDYYYVFTTKVFYSEISGEPIPEFETNREKVLPGLEIGDRFIAEITYDNILHVEEYDIVGIKQITDNESMQVYPSIYENKIVWSDDRNGNWDIYMYDLEKKQEKQITTDISDQFDSDIYENKIVYADNRNGNVEIYLYDLETGIEKRITNNEAQQSYPKIFENIVVWMDNRYTYGTFPGQDIYIYNLETDEEKQLTSNKIWEAAFEIHENKIVWEDMWTGGETDVSVYNLETENETRIELQDAQWSPDIYGNKIVWLDYNFPHVNGDVFLYDIITANQTQITFDDLIHQYNPRIYGNRIVWVDQKINGVEDIWLYDLETGQEKRITKDPSSQQRPEIFENRIVWQDNRNKGGNWDIYMYEIE